MKRIICLYIILLIGILSLQAQKKNNNSAATDSIMNLRLDGADDLPPMGLIADGEWFDWPLEVGRFDGNFDYSDSQDTRNFYNQYNGYSTRDVFYRFTITRDLTVELSLCGSELYNTALYLFDEYRNLLCSNEQGSICSGLQSYMQLDYLSAGTYFVVCEGVYQNGNINLSIKGYEPLTGDTKDDPIEIGTYGEDFYYSDTQNTQYFTNKYYNRSTNDVFYQFTTTCTMDLDINVCGSQLYQTNLYLFGENLSTVSNNYNPSCTGYGYQGRITHAALPPGTYYIVCEGESENGVINISVSGHIFTPPVLESQPTGSYNYIHTKTATENGITNSSGMTADKTRQSIRYFDGLGRLMENMLPGAGPTRQDLVTFQEYDAFGREKASWLTMPVGRNRGVAVDLNTIKKANVENNEYNDTRPFNELIYEASPLGRVVELQGAGDKWKDYRYSYPVKTAYLTNTASEELACGYYYFKEDGNSLVREGLYPTGALYVTKTTNEDGNVSYEFKDKLDRVVLQRQMNPTSDTYYVYDDHGNLCYVLPPLAADALTSGTFSESTSEVAKYAYLYRYDKRNRCIEKKLPGNAWIHLVYDRADRLILSQDGVQRGKKEWTFHKYDNLGREIMSGVTAINDTHKNLQITYENLLVTENKGSVNYGYTNSSSPQVTKTEILTVNYYDNYNWSPPASLEQKTSVGYEAPLLCAQGLLTGTLTKTLENTPKELFHTFYYDPKGKMLESHTQNILGGTDHEYYQYNFPGEIEKKKLVQKETGGQTLIEEEYSYTYDHMGRMTEKYHALNKATRSVMAKYEYNERGKLVKKNTADMDNTEYTYNVRNWTTGIKGPKFTENLDYTFGGNISKMSYKYNPISNDQIYDFQYDALDRMTYASYPSKTGLYYHESLGYDKLGNPTSLYRSGRLDNSTFGPIDALALSYEGNRLKQVTESRPNQNAYDLMEFKKGNTSGDQYNYDLNGNLIKDSNKNISEIEYNYLNLPKRIKFENGNLIEYIYDALGAKLQTKHKFYSLTTKNYAANKVYKDGKLEMVLTEDGYIEKSGNNYNCYYYLKDHLGNNRVVVRHDGTEVQKNDYYPFGLSFAELRPKYDQEIQPYKYNGKELDKELSLYDYGARMYDPALGRFMTMDPLAEKYYSISPYAYCGNNPVNAIDPSGKLVIFINGMHFDGSGGKPSYWGGFDNAVMKQLNDYNSLYRDGSVGGASAFLYNKHANFRSEMGYQQGISDVENIIKSIRDESGNLKETIKIISHSMGGAYAKGYVEALMNYLKENNISTDFIEFEADFAPYQPTKQKAVDGIDTYQFSHNKDRIAGKDKMEGAKYMDTSNDRKQDHGISTFMDQIKNLPSGKYKVENGQIVPL